MKRLILLLPAIILSIATTSLAIDDSIFVPHGQRNEIRYPGFYNVFHICEAGGDRIVVFSRGEFQDGDQSYRGLFAHGVRTNKKRGSKPREHLRGVGGSWGPNSLESVWPGDRQEVKKYGLLFAAITPDYDGTPAKIVISPFDQRGRPVGDQTVLHEIVESADNGIWVDSSKVAAAIGPDSIGVAFSYHLRTWNAEQEIYEYRTRVYFIELDFYGEPISELRQVELTSRNGQDVKARIFRPAWRGERWVFPIASRTVRDGEVVQDQLRTAAVYKKKIRVRTIDYANVKNITHFDGFVFSRAQFLPWPETYNNADSSSQWLFVQRRDYSPSIKPDVRRFDTYYSLYNIGSNGKRLEKPRQLKLDQWVPEMNAEGRYIGNYDETVTVVQSMGRKYFFVVVRQAELIMSGKDPVSEFENDLSAYSFKPNNSKIKTEYDDLASSEGLYRVTTDAYRNLVRMESTGSLVMPSGAFTSGYDQKRRCWLDLLRFDPVDEPSRPSARTDHAMAYSPDSGTALMFGGVDKGGLCSDLWQWDGNLWCEVDDGPGPAKRARHAMAYDEARKQFILFGGYNNTGDLGDTWIWDGGWSGWTAAVEPGARQGHAMAYCDRGKVIYLFGGRSGGTYFNDLWQWDGKKWTEIAATTPPSPRAESTIAWDPDRKRLIVAAGLDENGGIDDTWEYNPVNGSWVQTDGNTQWPRIDPVGGATAVYFEANKTLYLFGGYYWDPDNGYTKVKREMQRYQPNEPTNPWRAEYPATWIPARTGHAAVYDSARKQIVVFGGWDDGKRMADTWIWNGSDWFNIMP